MNWFRNIKVRLKLLLSFMIVLMIAVGACVFAITEIRGINDDYSKAMELTRQRIDITLTAQGHYSRVRMIMREVYYPDNNRQDLIRLSAEIDTELDKLKENLIKLYDVSDQATRATTETVLLQIERYRTDSKDTMAMLLAVDDVSINNPDYAVVMSAAQKKTVNMTNSYANEMTDEINSLSPIAIKAMQDVDAEESARGDRSMYISIGMLAVVSVITICIALYISQLISKPLTPLARFMMKAGTTGCITLEPEDVVTIGKYSGQKDEIGQTIGGASEFIKLVTNTAKELEAISSGDLTSEINPLSDSDTIGNSLKSMVDNLNSMFAEIQTSTDQVAAGAKQVADGAQELAQGATEQAASIQQLSSSITEIAEKTKENAVTAEKTSKLSEAIRDNAEKGSRQMDEMMDAVKEINESSHSISKIIKTIDEIAFQTNILALNAAIEAARAGQHGKGFAAVAEEVRNLAAKSAHAARETGDIIQSSMEKVEFGSCVAGETATSLGDIVNGIHESSKLITEIAKASEEQSLGISQINIGIDQVAQIVQQNSATAEESAAASEEMSSQSTVLEKLISHFNIKKGDAAVPRTNLQAPEKQILKVRAVPRLTEYYPDPASDMGKY